MATDAANDMTWLLHIGKKHSDSLQAIRHWNNIKVAADGDAYWLKDMTAAQIDSAAIRSIPFLTIYEVKEGKLFPLQARLPVRKAPASLLWTPVEKALPVSLPRFNHNYFGIEEKVTVTIVPSEAEQPGGALLISLKDLQPYIESAPAVRLAPLSWVVINDSALIVGTPLLPLPGVVLWQSHSMLLPSGYDLSLPFFAPLIQQKLDEKNDALIVWNSDGSYQLIPRLALMPLSISSFRRTMGLMINKDAIKEAVL